MNAPVTNNIDDREYAMPDMNFYSTFSPAHNVYSPRLIRTSVTTPYPTLKPIPFCCVHQQQTYSTITQQSSVLYSPTQDISSIEGPCGNSLMIQMNAIVENQQISMQEINHNQVVFIQKIGDGLFGSIHLAEVHRINQENMFEKQHVIVKSLNDNVGDDIK